MNGGVGEWGNGRRDAMSPTLPLLHSLCHSPTPSFFLPLSHFFSLPPRFPVSPLSPPLSRSFLVAALCLLLIACNKAPRPLLQMAEAAWQSGDYPAAAHYYQEFLQKNPDDPRSARALFELGNIYLLNLKQYANAQQSYSELLSRFPDSEFSYLARQRRAESYVEMGRTYEAIAEYENLFIAFPETDDRRRIRLTIADLYHKQHNYSQAEAEYQKVIDGAHYDSLSQTAYLRIGGINQLVRERYDKAIAAYSKVAEMTGDHKVRLQALYNIADGYAKLYKFDDAINVLKQIADGEQREFIEKRIKEFQEQKQKHTEAPQVDWGH